MEEATRIMENKNNFMKFSPSKILFPPNKKLSALESVASQMEKDDDGFFDFEILYNYIKETCERIFNMSAYGVSFLFEHIDMITPTAADHKEVTIGNAIPRSILYMVADGFGHVDVDALNHIYNDPKQLFVFADPVYVDPDKNDLKSKRIFAGVAERIFIEYSTAFKYCYCKFYKPICANDHIIKIELRCAYFRSLEFVDDVLITASYNYKEDIFKCGSYITIYYEDLSPQTIMGILCKIYMDSKDTEAFNISSKERMQKMIMDSLDKGQ